MRLLLAVLIFATACGGSSSTTVCTGMVMGKINGTLSVCNDFDQRYLQNLNQFNLSLAYTELPTSFVLNTEWKLKGEPDDRQYTQDTPNVDCKVTVKKGTPSWLARKGAGLPSSGNCQLTISALEANPQEGNVITYKSKGLITAHLEAEPGTGAVEVVTVEVNFCQGDAVFCPPPMM